MRFDFKVVDTSKRRKNSLAGSHFSAGKVAKGKSQCSPETDSLEEAIFYAILFRVQRVIYFATLFQDGPRCFKTHLSYGARGQ